MRQLFFNLEDLFASELFSVKIWIGGGIICLNFQKEGIEHCPQLASFFRELPGDIRTATPLRLVLDRRPFI